MEVGCNVKCPLAVRVGTINLTSIWGKEQKRLDVLPDDIPKNVPRPSEKNGIIASEVKHKPCCLYSTAHAQPRKRGTYVLNQESCL